MVPDFQRTTRALAADRGPGALIVAACAALLLGWGAWLVFGELTLYEASAQARVSAEGVARLRAPVAAEVIEVAVSVGQPVSAGALLVQLDAAGLQLQRAAAEARVSGARARLQASAEAGASEALGREAGDDASLAGLAASHAGLVEAQVWADEAAVNLQRVRTLADAGAASASEIDAAQAELSARQARVTALQREIGRASGQRRQQARVGEASASRDVEARSALEVELAAALAELARIDEDLVDRAVRAPIAGVVGELASLVPGQRVEAGAPLVVVVPEGRPIVEARFPPERAVGRVAPGQPARVRVLGGAGGVLGAQRATVLRAGSEPGADGLVTVELALEGSDAGLRHGLVAEVEVEVEQLSPLTLLVRAAGQASGGP